MAKLIDPRKVRELEDLDPGGDFFAEVAGIFIANAPQRLEAMGQAARAGNVDAALAELHSLKSAAGQVGAAALRLACLTAEDELRADASDLGGQILRVQESYLAACRALTELRPGLGKLS